MIPRRQIPNLLTVARLVLSAIFFLSLCFYRYEGPAGSPQTLELSLAIALFIVAAVTDIFDGLLARRWKVESRFGRIMDPFCDKILVMGALIFLAGPRFAVPDSPAAVVSGVYPWMVVVILARELLVTAIRAELESMGVKFGANVWGKLKMVLQSVVVPIVLLIVLLDPMREGRQWLAVARDVLVYVTVIVSVLSGMPYVTGAMKAARTP